MRKGRGFVYSAKKAGDVGKSGYQSTAGPGRAGGQLGGATRSRDPGPLGSSRSHDPGQQSTSAYGRSPLKRKRSPEQIPLSSAGKSKATGDL